MSDIEKIEIVVDDNKIATEEPVPPVNNTGNSLLNFMYLTIESHDPSKMAFLISYIFPK